MDSHFSHAAFASAIGGIRFPLLADFHPKGAVARSFGLYLDAAGITDRATVLIDANGVIQHISSVGPGGQRDMSELLAIAEAVDAAYERDLDALPEPDHQIPAGTTLFIRNNCMFSRWALYTRANLRLADRIPVRNVSDDPDALAALQAKSGKGQAPALDLGDEVLFESDAIARFLAEHEALP